MHDCLSIHPPGVVGELIDGEAILLNLDGGAYYSLNGTGSEVWALLGHGGSPAAVVEAMRGRYPLAEGVEEAVRGFLAELLGEGLLAAGGPDAGEPPPEPPPPGPDFAVPAFTKHTDMQDLLVLDPIHETDASHGWPHPRPEA